MLGSMTHQEWVEWQVFASTEPIGDRRADIRAAQIAYTVAASTPRRRGRRLPRFERFVPEYWKAKTAASGDSMLRFAAGLTKAMGGRVGANVEEALADGGNREAPRDAGP